MVTYNQCIGEVSVHLLHELTQGTNLLRGAGVAGFTSRVEAALVADPDRMPVMPHDMSPDFREMTTNLHGTVAPHHIVVTDTVLESTFTMPAVNIRCATPLPRPHRRAMNDN